MRSSKSANMSLFVILLLVFAPANGILSSFNKLTSPGVRASSPSLRFLEGNTWQLTVGNTNILIDPVMSTLDFGIPLMYKGDKRVVDGERELYKIVEKTDVVLISQGFDDHAHKPTLSKLSQIAPNMNYIAPSSALDILTSCRISRQKIEVVKPGDSFTFSQQGKEKAFDLQVTTGALLGPPWQAKENGYVIKPSKDGAKFPSIYYEPHCMFDPLELSSLSPVDIVITPVVSQNLFGYTLVGGEEQAVRLLEALGGRYLVPMSNGELRQEGLLAGIISTKGSVAEIEQRIKQKGLKAKVLPVEAGQRIALPSV